MEYDATKSVLMMDDIQTGMCWLTSLVLGATDNFNDYTQFSHTTNDSIYYPYYSQQQQASSLQLKAPRVATRTDYTFVMDFTDPNDTRSNKSGQHKANSAFVVNCRKQYWKTVYANGSRVGFDL